MDRLDLLIADRQRQLRELKEREERLVSEFEAEIVDVRQQRDRLAIELAAFEMAANARPTPESAQPMNVNGKSGQPDLQIKAIGRQRGAIAHDWRNTLRAMYSQGNHPLTDDQINAIAQKNGVQANIRSTGAQVRNYCRAGYMTRVGGKVRVTEEAARRFGFSAPTEANSAQSVVSQFE